MSTAYMENFENLKKDLEKGNVLLLGAPFIGKTYRILSDIKGDKLLFILSRAQDSEILKIIQNRKNEIKYADELDSEYPEYTLVIDDLYKVFLKCEERGKLKNLINILKREEGVCVSTTPYRWEWLADEKIRDENWLKDSESPEQVELFLKTVDEFNKKSKLKLYRIRDAKEKEAKKPWQYRFHEAFSKMRGISEYETSIPVWLLSSISEKGAIKILSELGKKFLEEGPIRAIHDVSDKITEDLHLKSFLKEILIEAGLVGSGVAGFLVAASIISRKRKGTEMNLPGDISELLHLRPPDIETIESKCKLEPLTLFNTRDLLRNSNKINELINLDIENRIEKIENDLPELKKVLERFENYLPLIQEKLEEIEMYTTEMKSDLYGLKEGQEILIENVEKVKAELKPVQFLPDTLTQMETKLEMLLSLAKIEGVGSLADSLLRDTNIQKKVDKDERILIKELSRKFENPFESMMHPLFPQSVESKVLKITEKLQDSGQELSLKCFLLAIVSPHKIDDYITILKSQNPPEKLFFILQQILFLKYLIDDRNLERATQALSELRNLSKTENEELLRILFTLILIEFDYTSLEDKKEKFQAIVNELNGYSQSEYRAFLGFCIAASFIDLGIIEEAEKTINKLRISEYFPESIKFVQLFKHLNNFELNEAEKIIGEITSSTKIKLIADSIRQLHSRLLFYKDPERAKEILNEILETSHSDTTKSIEIANLARFIGAVYGDYIKAEEGLRVAIDASPIPLFKATLLAELSFLKIRLNDFEDASEIIVEAEKLPQNLETQVTFLYLKALIEGKNNNNTKAEELLREGIRKSPKLRLILDGLTKLVPLLVYQNRFSEAETEVLMFLDYQNVPILFKARVLSLLGWIYQSKKEYNRALGYYNDALGIIAEEGSLKFIVEFGNEIYLRELIHGMLSTEYVLGMQALRKLNHREGFERFQIFPNYLELANSSWHLLKDRNLLSTVIRGCVQLSLLINDFGLKDNAIKSLEKLLDYDLIPDERSQILVFLAEMQMLIDSENSLRLIKEAERLPSSNIFKIQASLCKLKVLHHRGESLDADCPSIDELIEKIENKEVKLNFLNSLGTFFDKTGSNEIAEYYLRKALPLIDSKDEWYRRINYNLAHCYLSTTKPKKALEIFEELERLFPDKDERILIKLNKSLALEKLGKFDEVKKILDELDESEMNIIQREFYFKMLSSYYSIQKQWKEAIQVANSVLKSNPTPEYKNKFLLKKIAWLIELNQMFMADELLDELSFSELTEQQKIEYYILKQKIYFSEGRKEDAYKLFENAFFNTFKESKWRLRLAHETVDLLKQINDVPIILRILKICVKEIEQRETSKTSILDPMFMMKDIAEKIDYNSIKNDPELLFLYGSALVEKDNQKAEEILKICIQNGYESSLVYHNLSWAQMYQGKHEDAYENARKAVQLNPNDISFKFRLISGLISLKKFKEAEEELRKIKQHPLLGKAAAEMIVDGFRMIYESKEDYSSAIKELKEYIEAHPFDIVMREKLVGLYSKANRFDECINESQKIIEFDPDNITAHYALAVCFSYLKQNDRAEKEYLTCLKIVPNLIYIQKGYARLLRENKDYFKARKHYEEAVKIKPDDSDSWSWIAYCNYFLGEYRAAEETEKRAIQIAPNKPDYYHDLGHILSKISGRDREAIETFKEAISLDKDQPKHLECLSNFLKFIGHNEASECEETLKTLKEKPKSYTLICD